VLGLAPNPTLPCRPAPCSLAERSGRQIAIDVAEALCYFHTELRMLHSDLKAA